MKIQTKFLVYLSAMFIFANCSSTEQNEPIKQVTGMYQNLKAPAPSPAKKAHEITTHGDTRVDDYFWMRLTDEQKKAETPDAQTQEVVDYLNDENKYREGVMMHLKGFQDDLYDELIGRIKQTDMSVPYKKDGYYYITRYEEGKEYPIHARKKR